MRVEVSGVQAILTVLRAHLPDRPALSRKEVDVVCDLRPTIRTLRRGDDITVQGRQHDGIFLLVEGFGLRYRILADGRRQVLDVTLPGDMVGSPGWFLDSALHSVTALTPAAIMTVRSTDLDTIFEAFPRLGMTLFRTAASEAARLGEHLTDIGRRSARERVAHYLLELATRLEAVGLGTLDRFTLPITQVQLADIMGLSIPHTNRVLRRLREDGLLDLRGTRVEIRDRRALATLADFDCTYLGPASWPRAAEHEKDRIRGAGNASSLPGPNGVHSVQGANAITSTQPFMPAPQPAHG